MSPTSLAFGNLKPLAQTFPKHRNHKKAEPNTQLKNWKEKFSYLETVGVLLLVSEGLGFT